MSETSEAVETEEIIEVNDNASQEAASPKDTKPSGYHPVDLEGLPDDIRKPIEDRLKYMYKQIKDNERYLNDYRSVAKQQSQAIDDLTNGVGRVVDHLQTRSSQETESQVRKDMREAFEAGDNDRYLEMQEKLLDIKAQKLQPKQQVQQPRQPSNAREMAQEAGLGADDERLIGAWQDETDERGKPLRPWARTADMQRPDPDFVKAQVVAAQVWDEYPHRSALENLTEVDRRMGVQRTAPSQAVLGGGLTGRQKSSNITMTDKQKEIAVRTKYAGPKASEAEHIAAFKKQIEKVQSQAKGARR